MAKCEGTSGSALAGLVVMVCALTSATAYAEEGFQGDLLELHNQARSQTRYCGDDEMRYVEPLQWSDDLARAAEVHARDNAAHDFRGHTGSDGSSLSERVRVFTDQFPRVGENISYFTPTGESSMEIWLASPGHCRNIMGAGYTHMGAAMIRGESESHSDNNVPFWVVVFGSHVGEPNPEQRPRAGRGPTEEELEYLRSQPISVYGRQNCVLTMGARRNLEEAGVDYTFRDTTDDAEAHREMQRVFQRSDGRGTGRIVFPVMEIGENAIYGRTNLADMAFDARGYSEEVHGLPREGATGMSHSGPGQVGEQTGGSGNEEADALVHITVGVGAAGVMNESGGSFFQGHQFHLQGQFTLPIRRRNWSQVWLEPGVFAEVGMTQFDTALMGSSYNPGWQLQGGVIYQEWLRLSGGVAQQSYRDSDGAFAGFDDARLAFTLGGLRRWDHFQLEAFMTALFDMEEEDLGFFQLGLNLGYRF